MTTMSNESVRVTVVPLPWIATPSVIVSGEAREIGPTDGSMTMRSSPLSALAAATACRSVSGPSSSPLVTGMSAALAGAASSTGSPISKVDATSTPVTRVADMRRWDMRNLGIHCGQLPL